jgi:hypothetical protein
MPSVALDREGGTCWPAADEADRKAAMRAFATWMDKPARVVRVCGSGAWALGLSALSEGRVPQDYSRSIRHSDESGRLTRLPDVAVCSGGWVMEEKVPSLGAAVR